VLVNRSVRLAARWPTRGVTGVILTQVLPFCDARVLALFERFEADIYALIGSD